MLFSPASTPRLRRPADGPEISDDDDDDDGQERLRLWDRHTLSSSEQVSVARGWLEKSRRRLILRKVVRGIQSSALQSSCFSCGKGPGNLRCCLTNDGGFDGIVKAFEAEYGGEEAQNNPVLWKGFYRRSARFVTTCQDCSAFKPSVEEVERIAARGVDISSDEESDDGAIKFSGELDLTVSSTAVVSDWLRLARSRLEDEGKVTGLGSANNDSSPTTGEGVPDVDATGRVMISSWLSDARLQRQRKDESRGDDIRGDMDRTLSQMKISDQWLIGNLQSQGQDLTKEGSTIDANRRAFAERRDRSVQSVQTSLASITSSATAELEVINCDEKQDLGDLRSQHEHALNARDLELTRAGVGEKERQEELARERGRTEPELSQQENATKERHQHRREEVHRQIAKAKENADAAVSSLQQRFDTATVAPEREFRRQALRWIETSKRRLLVLESEKKRRA